MKFRKKPVIIEAMLFKGPQIALSDIDYALAFDDWCASQPCTNDNPRLRYVGSTIEVQTIEGVMVAQPGDWIIRGIKGELYPCKPDIFAETYEPAE